MIVVDTSVWIDYFAGRVAPTTALLDDALDGAEDVALTDVVLTEILQGLRTEDEAARVDSHLSELTVLRLDSLQDFRRAAGLYRAARRQGVTIRRTNDCLIASVCVREDLPLLHSDVDFDRLAAVTELRVVRFGAD